MRTCPRIWYVLRCVPCVCIADVLLCGMCSYLSSRVRPLCSRVLPRAQHKWVSSSLFLSWYNHHWCCASPSSLPRALQAQWKSPLSNPRWQTQRSGQQRRVVGRKLTFTTKSHHPTAARWKLAVPSLTPLHFLLMTTVSIFCMIG